MIVENIYYKPEQKKKSKKVRNTLHINRENQKSFDIYKKFLENFFLSFPRNSRNIEES